ncbi:MAG: UTP--glucose-1-phosphate uridylyltransferase [Spirochaetaceae bacterium]|nr:UTP--glucose-1-phosphate uridylyltransferase [Spirochaetaceae bacterium]
MKGIIVAAGYGTRFLPATKTLAKEMLPLIDKPAIAFIVEEFINSGINDIIIVTSRRKKVMDDYFDSEAELEAIFSREGAGKKLDKIKPYKANICFVRQQQSIGSGDALLTAMPWLGGDSAVVAYPDDLHFGEVPLAKQLIQQHNKTGRSVCAAMHVPGDVSRYGVLGIDVTKDNLVTALVEKPAVGTEPSHEVSIGRYLFTAEYFKELEAAFKNYKPSDGEFYHVYGLTPLIKAGKVDAVSFTGKRLDTGEPEGYLEAVLYYAIQQPNYKAVIDKVINKN